MSPKGVHAKTAAALAALTLSFTGVVLTPGVTATESGQDFTSQAVANGGDGKFPVYRIPSIVQLNNGDLVVSYDGRPSLRDAPNPNSILQRRSTDGGRTWGEQTVIHAGVPGAQKQGYSDPSYVYDAEKNILFNFHVYSKDAGFFQSVDSDDDAARNVMSAEVSTSTDNGKTWTHRLITNVVKPKGITGTFATSGNGIQVKHGKYAGRLVQQYIGTDSAHNGYAYSVYSDDHGATWHAGNRIGNSFNENKVVELSDGRLMLNSRNWGDGVGRLVAISDDGGVNWKNQYLDTALVDPEVNAGITRMNPQATSGKAAKELLFTNANNSPYNWQIDVDRKGQWINRITGNVRYSCDNGATWPVSRVYHYGPHAYSSVTALKDGTFAVAYETKTDKEIRVGTFGREWLKPFCANFAPASVSLGAGESTSVSVTIHNDDDVALPAGSMRLTGLPENVSSELVATPALKPGESATVNVKVTATKDIVADTYNVDATLEAGQYTLRGSVELKLTAPELIALTVAGERSDYTRDIVAKPYQAGEKLPFHWSIVNNTSNTLHIDSLKGPKGTEIESCSGDIAPGTTMWCSTSGYVVSEQEAKQGYLDATLTLTYTQGDSQVTYPVTRFDQNLGKRRMLPAAPTPQPTEQPTQSPTPAPTVSPTATPTAAPTAVPTTAPSPTAAPTASAVPSAMPSASPMPTGRAALKPSPLPSSKGSGKVAFAGNSGASRHGSLAVTGVAGGLVLVAGGLVAAGGALRSGKLRDYLRRH